MTVKELNREQIIQLKQNYMSELADNGDYSVKMGTYMVYEPSFEDLADADNQIPDDIIFEYYEGVNFTEEDF